MENNNKNFIIFLVVSFLLLVGWLQLQLWLWPPKPRPPKAEPSAEVQTEPKKEPLREKPAKTDLAQERVAWAAQDVARITRQAARPQPIRRTLILGTDSDNLKAILDSRGAAVRSVVLNKFQQADEHGRPVWKKDPEGNLLRDERGNKVPLPLELVRGDLNHDAGSYLLFHFDPERKGHDPLPTLGQINWALVEPEKIEPGQVVRRAVFTTEIDGVRITKTYTLQPGDYHIGLEVQLERLPGPGADQPRPFRYQLTSAHGLRTEGEWYTYVLRNALVGWRDTKRDLFLRSLEEAQRISHRLGGDPVEVVENDKELRWAGVAVQYFASMVVVDDEQEDQNFLARARATLEGAAMKGRIKSVAADGQSFVLLGRDGAEYTFRLGPPLAGLESIREAMGLGGLREGLNIAVLYTFNEYDQRIATAFRPEEATEPLFYNDIVARVATKPIELKAGAPVRHKYLLYNGPVKVRLLGQLEGDKAVAPELVDRYENRLRLSAMTDYHSPGWLGEFSDKIYFTAILIKATNLMHGVLWGLHRYIMPWSWGLCIIMLTVLVRGLMFPISRKQALTSIRMQELAPELKKLQEKYKNDRQALGMAQMELYRKHGVNPLGSCWLLLLQMPIFLGLYYALQESIHFRLAPFWPWIENLAAPDMLFWWTDQIPWISRPADYGSVFYLGPYFNLLPVLAVALMILQQSLLAPPAMDEQQAMQLRLMKYMMVIFGLMFYKVAAGLCIYFIASSLWGFAERKLLPKRKPAPGAPSTPDQGGFLQRLRERLEASRVAPPSPAPAAGGPARGDAVPAAVSAGPAPGAAGERRHGKRKRKGRRGEVPAGGPGRKEDGASDKTRSWWSGLREWWAEVLKQAEKR